MTTSTRTIDTLVVPDRVPLPDPRLSPSIPGIRARFFRDDADYEPLAEVISAAMTADGVPYQPTAANLRIDMESNDGTDRFEDVVLVEIEDRLVAVATVERMVRDDLPLYKIEGEVHPDLRRRGIGRWLFDWSIERSRARAAREDAGVAVELTSFVEDTALGTRALLAQAGFSPVRHFFLMRRDRLDDIPDVPLPDGLEIRRVELAHRRAIIEAENEAFRDHWGHSEMTESTITKTFARPELDTDLWVVAWDGDEIAGVVQNWIWPEENARLGVARGWLEHISVRRPWRRRGVARAITAASLVRMREAGMTEGMLGVDSENPNGALGLYEGLGFVVTSRAAAHRRPLEG
ncbi:MAG: GNAT family N-acetyltransferase [Chloroflexota bacterium]